MSAIRQPAAPAPPFFAIGRAKFVALSLTTFGLYQLVWLWQHWRHRRKVAGERVLPALRAVWFPWIFTIPLGYRIAKAGVASGTAGWLSALTAAILWTLFFVGSPFLPHGPWSALAILPILFATWLQDLANRVNAAVAPAHERNHRFTFANKVVVAIGSILFVLATVGLFLATEAVTVERHP